MVDNLAAVFPSHPIDQIVCELGAEEASCRNFRQCKVGGLPGAGGQSDKYGFEMRDAANKGDPTEFIDGTKRVAVVASNRLPDLLLKMNKSKRALNVFLPKAPNAAGESELKLKLGNMRARVQAKSYTSVP